ncbi:hypothetical protein BGX38DRAFT_296749 [Terfezia claveryi]|nr:hypothetical protein BGX38DRAFT_296749 [Terfezia claveryi]
MYIATTALLRTSLHLLLHVADSTHSPPHCCCPFSSVVAYPTYDIVWIRSTACVFIEIPLLFIFRASCVLPPRQRQRGDWAVSHRKSVSYGGGGGGAAAAAAACCCLLLLLSLYLSLPELKLWPPSSCTDTTLHTCAFSLPTCLVLSISFPPKPKRKKNKRAPFNCSYRAFPRFYDLFSLADYPSLKFVGPYKFLHTAIFRTLYLPALVVVC